MTKLGTQSFIKSFQIMLYYLCGFMQQWKWPPSWFIASDFYSISQKKSCGHSAILGISHIFRNHMCNHHASAHYLENSIRRILFLLQWLPIYLYVQTKACNDLFILRVWMCCTIYHSSGFDLLLLFWNSIFENKKGKYETGRYIHTFYICFVDAIVHSVYSKFWHDFNIYHVCGQINKMQTNKPNNKNKSKSLAEQKNWLGNSIKEIFDTMF